MYTFYKLLLTFFGLGGILYVCKAILKGGKPQWQWKEPISLKNSTDRKYTASWRECPPKTAAKSSPQEEQRAESTSATDKPPLCCRFCMKDGAAWRGANGKTIRGDLWKRFQWPAITIFCELTEGEKAFPTRALCAMLCLIGLALRALVLRPAKRLETRWQETAREGSLGRHTEKSPRRFYRGLILYLLPAQKLPLSSLPLWPPSWPPSCANWAPYRANKKNEKAVSVSNPVLSNSNFCIYAGDLSVLPDLFFIRLYGNFQIWSVEGRVIGDYADIALSSVSWGGLWPRAGNLGFELLQEKQEKNRSASNARRRVINAIYNEDFRLAAWLCNAWLLYGNRK